MKVANTLKTKHTINYKGHEITIMGSHRLMFAKNSKIEFTVWAKTGDKKTDWVWVQHSDKLVNTLEKLISDVHQHKLVKQQNRNARMGKLGLQN